MSIKFTIKGDKRLRKQLKDLEKDADAMSSFVVKVGYDAHYAMIVHENMNGSSPKFLETPLRQNVRQLGDIVQSVAKSTRSVRKALLAAGHRLHKLTRQVCPVKTGFLKSTSFVREG